jgi:hypothetical protein
VKSAVVIAETADCADVVYVCRKFIQLMAFSRATSLAVKGDSVRG